MQEESHPRWGHGMSMTWESIFGVGSRKASGWTIRNLGDKGRNGLGLDCKGPLCQLEESRLPFLSNGEELEV